MIRIISIDPGRMTGYCYAEVNGGLALDELHYHPFQCMDEVDDLWNRLEWFQPRYIVMEDFEFRGRARVGLDLYPVELIGVARLYTLKSTHQCSITLQNAATGKQYYTDTMLKSRGFYKRGIPHGMDASRHLLQWFTFGQGYQFNNGKQEFAEMLPEWKE